MSFDWSGYLVHAEHLNRNAEMFPNEEACYRSVVSRAYYAVYCLTRNFVRDRHKRTFSGNAHQELCKFLINHSDKKRKKLGNRLKKLHSDRLKADYDDVLGELAVNKASKALTQARRIKNSLSELTSN